jgi:hypothetical protein
MAKDWTFQLCHTLRKGNMCAEFLVKFGIRSMNDLLIMFNHPVELPLLLGTDNMCVTYHRGQ